MSLTDKSVFLEVSQEAGRDFFSQGLKRPIVMLNLLRFRKWADYTLAPELSPGVPINGQEAYRVYFAQMLPFLKRSGGEILFYGRTDRFLIGPSSEKWDAVMLVRQSSVQSFLAFASNPECMRILGHRTAAVEDSRLLPINEHEPFAASKAQ